MCFAEIAIDLEYESLELLCFDMHFRKCKMRFFVIYRPPYYDKTAIQYVDLLIKCLKKYHLTDHSTVNVVVGDLNCPKIDWTNLCSSNDYISNSLFKWFTTQGYYQFVKFPTRGNNILDLVLADDPQIISCIYPNPPLGHSDHCIVSFVLDIQDEVNTPSFSSRESSHIKPVEHRYNWYRADYDGIAQCICDIDWNAFLCYNPSALSSWYAFVQILWSAIDTYTPKFSGCKTSKRKHYPREIRKLIAKKRQLWNHCRQKPGNLSTRWRYRDCVNQLRRKCCDLEIQHEEDIITANDLGCFYKYINSRIQYRCPIGALINDDGHVVTSDEVKANMFNQYFASVGVVDDGKVPYCHYVALTSTLETVIFTEAHIISVINKLKSNLSSGPDSLPPVLFKNLKFCLARPLSLLFNQLLSVGVVPDEWKGATIIPVFKKGPAGDTANYRPISLTSVPCKIMERIIARHIYDHLVHCNLLSSAQHGFVRRRSTCTNLLETLNDWTSAVQSKKSVTVAYIDFSRAFDCVSHCKLFERLYSYGIRGNVLAWLKNFFCNRTHQTRVGQYLSSVADLLSGVVQGSGIGPVMFLLYIDELAKLLENNGVIAKLFADDVKVYVDVLNVNDAYKIQV